MTSRLTNRSADVAFSTMRDLTKGLDDTQNRIATGLKVTPSKDSAAHFSISKKMQSSSSATRAISERLTLTLNAVATARMASEAILKLAEDFHKRISFSQNALGREHEIKADLRNLVTQMKTTLQQSTFNGEDLLNAKAVSREDSHAYWNNRYAEIPATVVASSQKVVVGISRASGQYDVSTVGIKSYDMAELIKQFDYHATGYAIGATGQSIDVDENQGPVLDNNGDQILVEAERYLQSNLYAAEKIKKLMTDIVTGLGRTENTLLAQQRFINQSVNQIDLGVSAMIDTHMEEASATLQALQVQQQLALSSLSLVNQSPQHLLTLFQ